jgi:hypothetical protein
MLVFQVSLKQDKTRVDIHKGRIMVEVYNEPDEGLLLRAYQREPKEPMGLVRQPGDRRYLFQIELYSQLVGEFVSPLRGRKTTAMTEWSAALQILSSSNRYSPGGGAFRSGC